MIFTKEVVTKLQFFHDFTVFLCLEMNDKLVLPFYRSPPYLTAAPQIRYHRLGLSDRALVLARLVLLQS